MPYKDPKQHRDYYREYMRRRRAGDKPAAKSGSAADIAALKRQLAQAHKRIAELERRGEGQLTRSTRGEGRMEFSEGGKMRAEISRLKSDILKLKMMLQEEPDAGKLRKKVIDLQVEIAALRRELRKIAKERDEYLARVKAYKLTKHREARQLLTGQNYRVIIKAMHPDRSKHVTAAELAAAERLVVALRPLFGEG